MQPLITPAAMRDMEQRYFAETGTPSIQLMERAAAALCEGILRRFGPGLNVYFACGPGGNGGDGYACARMYAEKGGRCAVVPAAPARTPDAAEEARRAAEAGIETLAMDDIADVPDLWVDALYGTGLSRAPEGDAAALILRMNGDRMKGARIASVDIPSGLNGATGAAFSPCVQADATFTFQYAKPGHYLSDGLDCAGGLEVLDIGVPASFYPAGNPALEEAADVRALLLPMPRNLHKGMNGRLLIVAGSLGMAGAAAMAAQAALRSGAGLVTVACPASILPILQAAAPCAMGVPLPDANGALAPEAGEALKALLPGMDAVVCGCGLSRRAAPEAVRAVLESGVPALLDADALNRIAEDPALREALRPHHLLTPHPGEAARLLGRRIADPIADALALRELGAQALLKGAATVIPVGDRARISASGCCGMAKGGSGDVLAGLAGALMAQLAARGADLAGPILAECAAAASEIHGAAGEISQARLGPRGMCAQDLVAALPEAFLRYA